MFDWMHYTKIYFAISLLVIAVGIVSLLKNGLNLSIDFTGGSKLALSNYTGTVDSLKEKFKDYSPQIASQKGVVSILMTEISQDTLDPIIEDLKKSSANLSISSFEVVGPSLSAETLKKTLIGLLIASALLLWHITRAFKQIVFGVSAILAMFHDSLVLIGVYSIFSHFLNLQTDVLFVTAFLTVLSFSVHDTIVVYDRIRELKHKSSSRSIYEMANQAVSETMVRSLVNSLTIIFMLLALVLLGGESTRGFALALLIGTISGTYSSPFTAVPLLVLAGKKSK